MQDNNHNSQPSAIDNIDVEGVVTYTLLDEHGNVKVSNTVPNLIVTTGKVHIASRLISNSGSTSYFIGVGTDDTDPAVGQSDLIAPQGTRVAATATQGTSPSNNKITFAATFAPGNPSGSPSLKEAGIFTASTGGSMLNRVEFSPLTKEPGDTLLISWDVTIN